jgi:hypothetical protein
MRNNTRLGNQLGRRILLLNAMFAKCKAALYCSKDCQVCPPHVHCEHAPCSAGNARPSLKT